MAQVRRVSSTSYGCSSLHGAWGARGPALPSSLAPGMKALASPLESPAPLSWFMLPQRHVESCFLHEVKNADTIGKDQWTMAFEKGAQ